MGGAARFMTLLTTPFPHIRPSRILLHRRLSTISISPLRSLPLCSPKSKPSIPQPVKCFHSPPDNNTYAIHQQQQNQHPWPEWTQFLNILSNGQGYFQDCVIPEEDAFVVYEELTDEFVGAASRCIAFARARPDLLRLLSRRDIEAVVSNGTPFLFKSALNTSSRMRAFLGSNAGNVLQVDEANTIDLMKYIISYASNPVVPSERNGLYSKELVDSSVRNLLLEMGRICNGASTGRDEHAPMPFGQNIEMKRGDWICPKCNFMNFARNMKCLECEESRPRKQLSGGEWDCPECNFFNYGRNRVCLRCECRRPGAPSYDNAQNIGTTFSPPPGVAFSTREQTFETSNFSNQQRLPDSFQSPEDSSTQTDIQNETQKSERWFQRISELHNVKDLPSAVSDEDFPEIMPMRKGENRFVVSKKKDRSLTSPQYKRQVAMDQANTTNFVPFVPFPPDYFARKDPPQPTSPVDSSNGPTNNPNTTSTVNTNPQTRIDTGEMSRMHNHPTSSPPQFGNTTPNSTNDGYSDTGKASELAENDNIRSRWTGPSLEGSAVRETDPLDMSEEAKAERWFKRVAQIKDISELSQIPDEDFPSIMPMRKGVNRFVVSKRKTPLERRLTSQQYRRNLPVVSNDSVKKESEDS